MKIEELKSYEVVEKKNVEDLKSEGYLLRHKKTGARVMLLSNDDENKVFCIGFRTPPVNSTGVAHILEHSVLCGSDKFPVKDPFVELVKGSLNTFLNAMTYPDKTVYPLASCNDADFQNLMDVYLDAVLHPNIYNEEKIFRQEGWHYEMQSPEDDLTINGVVYNEMKGAFSSPDEVFAREQLNSLYPDTTYGLESGGAPEVIPELSYEEFLDFHGRYYHPSNSYIYLYGNMDMAEKLDFIDKEYLSKYEKKEVDSTIKLQKAFDSTRRVVKEYAIGADDSEEKNTYLSYNVVVGDSLDAELSRAFDILDYALCGAPGAPLKQALTDAGIGTEITNNYEADLRQPLFCIAAKNAELSQEKEFVSIIRKVLTEIVEKGFDKKSLQAGLNYFEFRYREADYGRTPTGLIYGLNAFDSWLYDETKPFLCIEANAVYASLRKKIEEGYFEGLVKKYLLENPHSSVVILSPKKGLTEQKEKELADKLAAYKASLSKEQIEKIVEDTKALKAYQEQPDTEEDLNKIPMLKVSDIGKKARTMTNEVRKIGDTELLHHDLFTNGISYLRVIFKLDKVPARLFPYVPILTSVMGLLNTKDHSYADLSNDIYIQTGGITAINNAYTNEKDECTVTMEFKTKVLDLNLSKAVALIEEIMLTSDLTDKKRLKEIIAENRSRMQADMVGAAHVTALNRALSYVSKTAEINEHLSGMDLFRMLENLDTHFEDEADHLIDNLKELAETVFRPENLMVDLTASREMADAVSDMVEAIKAKLYTTPAASGKYEPELSKKNEGFKTPGQVLYVCRAGNYKDKGLEYTGVLQILKGIMRSDYLWNNVRVKGGAYGCMCNFGRKGDSYFVSYRDPNLKNTVEVYEKAADHIASLKPDERMMTQVIIGAISDLDMPMNASAKGLFSLSGYMTGLTDADLQKERDEILAANAEDVRKTAAYIRAFMEDECLCVVGNADKITEAKDIFGTVENLAG